MASFSILLITKLNYKLDHLSQGSYLSKGNGFAYPTTSGLYFVLFL